MNIGDRVYVSNQYAPADPPGIGRIVGVKDVYGFVGVEVMRGTAPRRTTEHIEDLAPLEQIHTAACIKKLAARNELIVFFAGKQHAEVLAANLLKKAKHTIETFLRAGVYRRFPEGVS